MNEVQRWCPTLNAVCLIGTMAEREKTIDEHVKPRNFEVGCFVAFHGGTSGECITR
jgi:hypothetical protein